MADEVIGRADYVLGVDNAGVKRGVAESEQIITASGAKTEAEYTSGAYRAGVVIGNGIKTGAKIVAAGASGLFAIATKGVLDLTNVQADYTAETGATADEAARAGRAINDMAGRNIQPLAEIGATAAKVRTNLGLVGDEGNAMTEVFLRFARATKQDAVGAVSAFDDILDTWHLKASDAQGLMDKLIVSHQKYGGSIEENQRALAALAPQLQGLNLTIDDGIGLLNLFASSGLDASAAQTALNTAITKLPKGESLTEFLTRLSQVSDDGQRAQLAMDVFGQKAGAKLANAIRPGVASLDSFKVSTQEATGATDKAADALDSTFGARAQLMINKFASALRGVGSDWGPLLTGAASAGTLLSSIFGEEAIRKLGPKIVGAFKSLGSQASDALADGISQVGTGAGGTVAGNFIASRIETMVDSSKNSRIAEVIRTGAAKAGALWGVVFAGVSGVASTLGTALAGAIGASAAGGAARAAVLAAAIELGTLEGTAIASAAALAIAAAPVLLLKVAADFVIDHSPGEKSFLEVNRQKQALVDAGKAVWIDASAAITPTAIAATTDTSDAAGDAMVRAWKAQQLAGKMADDIVAGAPKIATAVTLATKGAFGSDLAARSDYARAVATRLGNVAAGALAQGMRDKRAAVDTAWQALLDAIHNGMRPAAERAKLVGELVSTDLIWGLKSKDPAVRAQARATKQAILDRLEELGGAAKGIGKTGMDALKEGMKSKDHDVRLVAYRLYKAALHGTTGSNGPADVPDKAKTWGLNTGQNFADGLEDKAHAAAVAASHLAGAVGNYLKISSPSKLGPFSTLGGPEGWGRRLIDFYAKGIDAGLPGLTRTLDRGLSLRGMSLAGMNPTFLGDLAGGRAAQTSTTSVRHGDVTIGAIHLHGIGSDVSPAAASRFGQNVLDEVSKGFREQGARRGIHPAVVP